MRIREFGKALSVKDLPLLPVTRWLASIVLLAIPASVFAEVVQYEVTFDSLWTAETHPIDYPSGAHYSAHIGATHNADYTLWGPGEISTEGMKNLAELGTGSPGDAEIEAAIEAGTAYGFLRMPAPRPVGTQSRRFNVSSEFPLMSLVTMIAPSPDWFVGFRDVDLQDGGDWVSEVQIDAWPYDAGTDSGTTYQSPNEPTEPFEPMFRITDGVMEGTPRFGVYTISLTSTPGDLNRNESVGADDISFLCANLGTSDPRFEFTGDDIVTAEDLAVFVETRLDTRLGDTDLDGNVDFDDFLALSANFGRDFRDWRRGDTNCDQSIDFDDFLAMSAHFGFDRDAGVTAGAEAAAVPEPSSLTLGGLLLAICSVVRRRRRV